MLKRIAPTEPSDRYGSRGSIAIASLTVNFEGYSRLTAQSVDSQMTQHHVPPEVLPAQIATGILEWSERIASGKPIRMPYPANLQAALNGLTLLAWRQGVDPPASVVHLLELASEPFGDWPVALLDPSIDPDESLLAFGRPTDTCEELGRLRGDVEGEIRQNLLVRAVMDKTRAADAPGSYVAFRRLLIEEPVMPSMEFDAHLARPELAMLSQELHDAYVDAPAEAAAGGVIRLCGGCGGVLLPLEDDRTWVCEDTWCPTPGADGGQLPVREGVRCLRRELRSSIAGPGRAELRIARAVEEMGVSAALWPDFDACDLAVFDGSPWVADIKAWRNPVRLGIALRQRSFDVPAGAERAFVVIAREQAKGQPRYLDRLRRECGKALRARGIRAVSEATFLREVAAERVRRSR